MHYDLIVIGSGPAGQKGAIAAAKLHKRVALVERKAEWLGGVCLHTGTIPSKTMREAILHLTGYRQREVYNEQYRRKRQITMADLRRKLNQVTQKELDVLRDQMERNRVDLYAGQAKFTGPDEVVVESTHSTSRLTADKILIACGTRPSRPAHIQFDGEAIFDSDELLSLHEIPRSMIVVGGGVIGIEYAIMFAALGVEITVVDGREELLEFVDREIVEALMHHARTLGIWFRLGEKVVDIHRQETGRVVVELESQKRIIADTVLFSVGRVGDTSDLHLGETGLVPDERGRIICDENFQTDVPSIYAVGDIVGFPSLASAAMEQGRRAICHAFGAPYHGFSHMPYGLFTIPEISMVGKTERQLTRERVPYEVGVARFNELPRGQISGDEHGMLKLLIHRHTRKILGVHCIGEAATEIIHLGQAVMSLGGTIDYFCESVYNHPTMSECYKVAAFDGRNRLDAERAGLIDTSHINLPVESDLSSLITA